ncbi:MAG: class I SAM-dependent methyltransferase [Chloroflexi bacterium]|nr:class I SAM-dependent methyltransferase [Chloroflexota bacterium]
MTTEASGPNAKQIKLWNEVSGPNWVAQQEEFDERLEALGLAAMDRARIEAGERVLDIGCGTGQATLELARRVSDGGSVLGIDISAPMLDRARSRAAESGVRDVTFEKADAQTFEFGPARFDLIFSRFGVMFFDDPLAAFSNLRNALRPGGRLAFVCWRDPEENPWATIAVDAVGQHIPIKRPKPGVPGPFGLADSGDVAKILDKAGFSNVGFEEASGKNTLGTGGSLEDTVAHVLKLGMVADALREAEVQDTTEIAASIREAFARYATPTGVHMNSAAWIVTARSP